MFKIYGLLLLIVILFALLPPGVAEYHPDIDERIVTDMMNRSVHLKGTVKRTMLFTPMPGHYITVDGGDTHIAYVAGYLREEASGTLLGDIFPDFSTKKEALTSESAVPLGVEQILLEKPDAVLSWAWFAHDLENVRFPGIVELINNNDPEEAVLFKLLGKLTGKTKRAEALLQRYDREMENIRACGLNKTQKTRLAVIGNDNYFFWNKNFRAFNNIVKEIGGVNVAESIHRTFNGSMSIEEIIKMNPQVIFLAFFYSNHLMPSAIYGHPALRSIDAVRNHRVYRMPNGVSRMSGPVETPLLLGWMARLLHPEIPWADSFRDEIYRTYHEVYGYTLSEAQIDKMLNINENKYSDHYKKFLFNR